MNEDIKRVLEELEQDLLEDMPQKLKNNQKVQEQSVPVSSPSEEDDIDAILAKILAEGEDPVFENQPAFKDPDKLDITEEPVRYYNYSNDYGSRTAARKKSSRKQEKSEDKWLIALMGVASVLCLGIIGILVYWMQMIP